MTPAAAPVRLALRVADAALADRLAGLLGDLPGVRLVADGAQADAVIGDAATGDAGSAEAADALDLTPREREVLALLSEGLSNPAIAAALGISVHTAKFHVGRVIDKLDATGRTDAVAQACRIGAVRL